MSYKARIGIASGVIAFVLLVFLIFILAGDVYVPANNNAAPAVTDMPEAGTGQEKSMSFSAEIYEVKAHQEIDMSQYLKCMGIAAEDVRYSSDSEGLIVGSNGHVVAGEYGADCRLTAVSSQDETLKAECLVRTRSEEDDFVYLVETLNGGHKQDEVDKSGVVQLTYSEQKNQMVNVEQPLKKPKKAGRKKTWNKSLFYKLEDTNKSSDNDGLINTYLIYKKRFINEKTGNDMEYEIYRHPDNGVINKIVSIERKDKELEVTEYYYTDSGRVNFVYVYSDVNYTPSYAIPTRDGQRFLFDGDSLVTWRIVKNNKETNYCINTAEQKRVAISHPNVKLYGKCSKKLKKQYKKKELQILNGAYNTMNKIENYDGISTICGYLNNQQGTGLDNATVTLSAENRTVYSTATDMDGYYEIKVPTIDADYELEFAKASYKSEKLYEVDTDTKETTFSQENIYLANEDSNKYMCTLYFYDALNKADNNIDMMPLYNVYLTIRSGVNNQSGETVYEGYVNGSNLAIELPVGMYTVNMSTDNYIDAHCSLFVSGETNNRADIYATPRLEDDEYRIVLTWNEIPYDLDSHLFAPVDDVSTDDYHICYYHMGDDDGNTVLDVDDTNSYGPETVTIRHIKRGQYKYYVADFTNCSRNIEDSMEMSNSMATVRVYDKDGLADTFYVPANKPGVIWEVFEIRDGNIVPIQRYYDSIGNKDWWKMLK